MFYCIYYNLLLLFFLMSQVYVYNPVSWEWERDAVSMQWLGINLPSKGNLYILISVVSMAADIS